MSKVESILAPYRGRSRGPVYDPIASVFDRILLGPGCHFSPMFMQVYNITHIVNCAFEIDCPRWVKYQVGLDRYACMNAPDTIETNIIRDYYPKFEGVMDTYLRDPRCRTVYVHCQAGMNRSATLIAAYIHKRFRIPMAKLIDHIAKQRPCIMTNPAFQSQLAEFGSL